MCGFEPVCYRHRDIPRRRTLALGALSKSLAGAAEPSREKDPPAVSNSGLVTSRQERHFPYFYPRSRENRHPTAFYDQRRYRPRTEDYVRSSRDEISRGLLFPYSLSLFCHLAYTYISLTELELELVTRMSFRRATLNPIRRGFERDALSPENARIARL